MFVRRRNINAQSRMHIDLHDVGLYGLAGAKRVITQLQSHPSTTSLVLSHNDLEDIGCIALFKFLSSGEGKGLRIRDISLNSNGMGDDGLDVIGEHLNGNECLETLFLQNNKFSAHSQFKLRSFVSSLNTSHLQTLSFTCNPTLSDAFVSTFLLNLSSPHLHALHLSAMDLSPLSTPVITSYLESRRSYPLRILKLNGNRIGFSGVRKIVRCIERSNFTLLSIELFANTSVEPQEEPSSSSSEGTSDEDRDGDGEDRASSSRLNEILRVCLARNKVLRDRTCRAAVELLPVARVLLLRSVRRSSAVPLSTPAPTGTFPFLSLPSELQLQILSHLSPSPTLSPSQFARITSHASSLSTLPSIRLTLPRNGDKVMGKEEKREEWLGKVECAWFEKPEDGNWMRADAEQARMGSRFG